MGEVVVIKLAARRRPVVRPFVPPPKRGPPSHPQTTTSSAAGSQPAPGPLCTLLADCAPRSPITSRLPALVSHPPPPYFHYPTFPPTHNYFTHPLVFQAPPSPPPTPLFHHWVGRDPVTAACRDGCTTPSPARLAPPLGVSSFRRRGPFSP